MHHRQRKNMVRPSLYYFTSCYSEHKMITSQCLKFQANKLLQPWCCACIIICIWPSSRLDYSPKLSESPISVKRAEADIMLDIGLNFLSISDIQIFEFPCPCPSPWPCLWTCLCLCPCPWPCPVFMSMPFVPVHVQVRICVRVCVLVFRLYVHFHAIWTRLWTCRCTCTCTCKFPLATFCGMSNAAKGVI